VGLGQGRMLISYGILFLSILLLLFYCKHWVKTKINLIGIVLLSIFLIIFLQSYFFSPAANSDYGLWKIRQFVSLAFLPAFLILIAGKLKKNEMSLIENFILFSCIATSVVVLFNLFTSGGLTSLQSDWFNRQSIGDMNPIWLSRFLGIGLLVLQAPRFEKKPAMVIFFSLILVITALLTGSKTVLYFTIPVIVIYRLFNSKLNNKMLLNIMVLIGIICIVSMFFNSINSAAWANRFSLESGTVGMREVMLQTTLNAFLASDSFSMLFGHGGGTIGNSMGYGYVREYPHNLLIEILYELGIIGIVTLMVQFLFAAILFFKGLKNWVFFAYVLHVLFSLTSGDLVSNNLIFIFFALYLVSERESPVRRDLKRKR
jgi:O-antigen ligase